MNREAAVRELAPHGFGQFERDGFQLIPALIESPVIDRLSAELAPLFQVQAQAASRRIGGVRNLLRTGPLVQQLAKSTPLLQLLEVAAGSPAFPVRAIFFDKNPAANWMVPWHQDLAIAVAKRIDTPGFTGWSVKDGVAHVHPPRATLEEMITLRLHLDDCHVDNGALRVIAGSHSFGKLAAADIARWTAAKSATVCEMARGDALLMRPLLLHASPPAERPGHRRVLHLEYATQALPNGLEWLDN